MSASGVLGRGTSFTDMEFLSDEYSEKFVSVGFWDHEKGPHEWRPAADEVIHRTEFWQVMRDCLTKLPQKVRDVFTMREMDDVPSKGDLRDPIDHRQQFVGDAASGAYGAAGMS